MLQQELSQLESHIQMLDKMAGVLFEFWNDHASNIFKEKCIGAIKKEWNEYKRQMTDYSTHLKNMKQEMDYCEQSMKKVQDGRA